MKKHGPPAAIALCLALSAPELASPDAVDDFVKAQMEKQKIPGVSVAVCRDGQIVKAAGYGLANVELDVPAKPETIYQSGSVGKQFTAMAVMMLVEEGKLGLDDPLPKHFPGAPGGWKSITVRNLLTHTSGIKDWEGGKELDYRRDYSEDDLAKVAMKMPPDFVRGERVIEHGGSWQGFRTAIVRYPDRRLAVIVLANLAQAQPERMATAIGGILEPTLALPDPRASHSDPDPARTTALRGVLEAWAKGTPSAAMAKGLRGTHAGTAREKRSREAVGKQIGAAKDFVFLAVDDVSGRGIERRGESIARIAYYGLRTGEGARRYRFFLNEKGEVADFSSEAVD